MRVFVWLHVIFFPIQSHYNVQTQTESQLTTLDEALIRIAFATSGSWEVTSYCKYPPNSDSNLVTKICDVQRQTEIQLTTLDKAVLGIVSGKGPCEVNSYCKADILQVLIATSSPSHHNHQDLHPKRELKYLNFHVFLMAKSLIQTLSVLISYYVSQSAKCLIFFLHDGVSIFPSALGESSQFSKAHPFQEVGLNWLLAIFSPPTIPFFWSRHHSARVFRSGWVTQEVATLNYINV